ncbi:MAG: hypothetical protein ABW098_04725 [Candidatus Thiodiazotropha sp.]
MLGYILFDAGSWHDFINYLKQLGLAPEGKAQHHVAGVNVTLRDGRVIQAVIDPGLMRRLLTVVSPQELGEFVDTIVAAVENPDDRPLCQR